MRDPNKPQVCSCGRGYMSLHDHKCGNCRTKREKRELDTLWKQQDRKQQALAELQATIDRTRARISP